MNSPPLIELTTRARDIFRLVVEGYLASGQPVGSKTLAGQGVEIIRVHDVGAVNDALLAWRSVSERA